jgi:hypothetical protein
VLDNPIIDVPQREEELVKLVVNMKKMEFSILREFDGNFEVLFFLVFNILPLPNTANFLILIAFCLLSYPF